MTLALLANGARADDAAESRFFDGLARAEYAHRHYAVALELFLRAHRAAPSSHSLYNIALCAELANRDAMAFTYLDELLAAPAASGDETMRTDATRRRDRLARTLALVRVVSDPPGATIYVDQRDHGSFGTTPRTLALAAGAHHVALSMADHADATTDVRAMVGRIEEASVALPPHLGAVTITTSLAGATIVARRDEAEIPIRAGERTELPVGTYTFVASAPGHREATLEARIAHDADEHRLLTLAALPVPTGRLLVTTGDVHARIQIDGVDRAETPARLTDVGVGMHEVRVSANGYIDWSGSIAIEESRTAFVSVTLVHAR
jgi:outer membrane receptor for ferrienterochelin and colicins